MPKLIHKDRCLPKIAPHARLPTINKMLMDLEWDRRSFYAGAMMLTKKLNYPVKIRRISANEKELYAFNDWLDTTYNK